METLDCPSLKVLKQQSSYSIHCPFKHNSYYCALNNVHHLTKWIIEYWNKKLKDKNIGTV